MFIMEIYIFVYYTIKWHYNLFAIIINNPEFISCNIYTYKNTYKARSRKMKYHLQK